MYHRLTKAMAVAVAAAITLLPVTPAFADNHPTATPIKHLIVIFQENVSFDHYFATYPHALNPAGEPAFQPTAPGPQIRSDLIVRRPPLRTKTTAIRTNKRHFTGV